LKNDNFRLFKALENYDTKTFKKSSLKTIKSEALLETLKHEKIASMHGEPPDIKPNFINALKTTS